MSEFGSVSSDFRDALRRMADDIVARNASPKGTVSVRVAMDLKADQLGVQEEFCATEEGSEGQVGKQ